MQRRTALVTGGSRGIGRAVATRLAAGGYDIAFCSRHRDGATEETVALVEKEGARAVHVTCDVADHDAVRAFVATAEAALGPTHLLVTSAGITRDKPLALMSGDDWTGVLDANLSGVFHACRSVLRGMLSRRAGSVVTITSVAGLRGNAGQANYAAAKAGIVGLTMSLAKEVAGYGIRVNAVAPGFIDTEMVAGLPDAVRRAALDKIAMRRFGSPASVAEVVEFLGSDRASYITGQVVQVDGGLAL